ncbi:hypothetical protein BC830DRAFT_240962 [Chytriomyces sp. MP71]|nr:hypothetical protein BC830DRAFT_240962 [Chytriomyces sp. MP71]
MVDFASREQKEEDGDRTCTTDYEDALKRFYGLLSRHDSAKSDQSKKCDILLNLGIASGCLRKLSAAQNFLERSLKIAKELGDEDTVARVYFNLSNLFQKANELPRALEFLQRELLVHKKANNIDGCMETYWEIALLQQKMQKYEDAISTLNHYIGAAKKLSDNSAQDRAHDLLRALEENIQHKMKISQLSAQLDTARRNKAPPRAQFKLLWEIADLRMLLSQHEPALQAFTALQNFSRGIPLNATETDAITKGLGDANAALGRFDAAIVQYRSLLSRWTGLTAERAEVLWKLSDCIARGNASIDAITSPLIECDRIGIHLRNRAIQYQAQSRLADVYTHFKYLDKAQRARARAVELECIIEADGVGSNDYDDEEDDNVIGERGDVCDDDDIAITGKEKTEEASRRGRTIGKSDGRRTSGIVEKLDFTLESSPERRIAEEKKRRSAPRKIIPVQSHLYNTQGILSLDKRETILLSSSPTHSDGDGTEQNPQNLTLTPSSHDGKTLYIPLRVTLHLLRLLPLSQAESRACLTSILSCQTFLHLYMKLGTIAGSPKFLRFAQLAITVYPHAHLPIRKTERKTILNLIPWMLKQLFEQKRHLPIQTGY